MPTYEYACKACGEHLEVVQSFMDAALTTCPACGGPLRKVFGSIGISFKGSGFYRTDSRAASAKASKPAASESASSSDAAAASSSSSSSSESKTDTKAGSKAEPGSGSSSGSGSGTKTESKAAS